MRQSDVQSTNVRLDLDDWLNGNSSPSLELQGQPVFIGVVPLYQRLLGEPAPSSQSKMIIRRFFRDRYVVRMGFS